MGRFGQCLAQPEGNPESVTGPRPAGIEAGMDFRAALRRHWPEYLIEAFLLGAFMVSALGFTVLLEHPASRLHAALPDPTLRRGLMGLAMGCTAITLVYSPWGQRSGAHFNPAFTLTFFRLGKIEPADALGYVAAQFAGGVAGVLAIAALLGERVAAPTVNYAVTLPGMAGAAAAFAAEVAISFVTMLTVLVVSNGRLARFTPLFVGTLVATWITLEAPLSGMSMNPARSFSSAAGAQLYASLWLYFSAPLVGMFAAAEVFVRTRGLRAVHCAKLHHQNAQRCIFRCGYAAHDAARYAAQEA
jgi:aquaporin Z